MAWTKQQYEENAGKVYEILMHIKEFDRAYWKQWREEHGYTRRHYER